MKKTHKRVVGFFGLLLVAAMTIFAATLPDAPRASAITDSVVDTLQIRVIGDTPSAKFVIPTENVDTSDPAQSYKVDYENITDLVIKLVYTNEEGVVGDEVILGEYHDLDFYPGSVENDLDLAEYGYGKFVLSTYGTSFSGNEMYLDGISFVYTPIIVSAEQDEDTGLVNARIEEYGDDVETVDIYFEGEYLKTVARDDFDEIVKLSLGRRESGYYNLVFVAKNGSGKVLGTSYKALFYYNIIYVPDTGGLFKNLNISKADYLITGLIIFFVFGIAAFVMIVRRERSAKKK